LVIDLGKTVPLQGITYLPRQDMANGRIVQCEIYCSSDPSEWSDPAAKVKWPNSNQLQTVRFKQVISARYLKVLIRSAAEGSAFASMAEMDVIVSGSSHP
jgi:hypothetical protein